MKDFNLNKLNVLKQMKELKLNNKASQGNPSGEMAKLQKNILMQASLALLTIVLTVVILFAVTSAWYTNIVQTGGLVFNVESWGFKGEVIIDETPITVAPGDSGAIYLTAQNENEDIIELNVNVQKTKFHSEMQKRLFFYVDAQTTRNGETMERVYVNGEEDYTYTLFGKGSLTLTEDVANAPRLKWHWVYDLLGYYVLGTQSEDGTVAVKEYLRPIEYDLDSATFSIVGEGEDSQVELITVDGTTTVAQFLTELSEKDGYEGTLSFEEGTAANAGVYYEISAPDSDGCGIYAYLCTYSEIETATDWDTETGELAYTAANNPDSTADTSRIMHEADINISAQKSEIVATEIKTATDLAEAIANGSESVFKLTENITLEETLSIPEGKKVMIDLNGNTITSENATSIEAAKGSSLTVTNGIINGPEEATGNTYGVKTVGAEVVMNNVEINNYVYGIYVGDNAAGNTNDSSIYLNNCNIDVSFVSVFVSGNGAASGQNTTVVIEDSTLKSSGGYALSGNGSDGRWGTDIQIINSTLESEKYAAVYHPQRNSTLTVSEGSNLIGNTGIAIKAGFVTIIDSNITGNGAAITEEPTSFNQSGFNITNDAIYIETNYGHPIGLEIKGSSEITSNNNKAIRVYEENAENVTISIYGGTFTPGVDFGTYPLWLAEGSLYVQNKNNVFVYVESVDEEGTELTQ